MILSKIFGLLGLTILVALPAWAEEELSESTDLAESEMEMNNEEVSRIVTADAG